MSGHTGCMDPEQQQANLDAWWARLTDDDRSVLLTKYEGDELPGRYVADLTNALGIGPVGTAWQSDPGYTFHVDERVADFLDRKRDRLERP
jgi:hypothetical protein